MDYRVDLRKDSNDTILVTFPDLPGVHTFGDTRAEAIERALDAFLTGVEFYIKTRRPVPAPKKAGGARLGIPALVAAKVELHNTMVRTRVNKAELGRRLEVHPPQVDRLVNLRHDSNLEQLERAFRALGRQIEIKVVTKSRAA